MKLCQRHLLGHGGKWEERGLSSRRAGDKNIALELESRERMRLRRVAMLGVVVSDVMTAPRLARIAKR